MGRLRSINRIIAWLLVANMATVMPMAFGKTCHMTPAPSLAPEAKQKCPCGAKRTEPASQCCRQAERCCCQNREVAQKKCNCGQSKLPRPVVPLPDSSRRQLRSDMSAVGGSQGPTTAGDNFFSKGRRMEAAPRQDVFFGRSPQAVLGTWLI